MKSVSINKEDVVKNIYFITALVQKQNSSSMQGALSSKGDQMGGIFDRWINTVPESIVFNKIILPEIDNTQSVEIIPDFYIYDPRIAGIASDIIGIRIKEKAIPFVIFNEKWKAVDNMPQIEIKTFKKNQKMISLRNQEYDTKYLIMTESEFIIDYLLPFFDQNVFSEAVYRDLIMDDSTFIVSNTNNNLHGIDTINLSNQTLGTVTLLKITTASSFITGSTFCEGTVSVQYINDITIKSRAPAGCTGDTNLSYYCNQAQNGLYRFNEHWYEGINSEGIPYYTKNSKQVSNTFLFKTLDLYIDNINEINVIKKSHSSIYIKTTNKAQINEYSLLPNSIYRIDFSTLDRSSNNGEEYFLQKSLISHILSFEDELKRKLKSIIDANKE